MHPETKTYSDSEITALLRDHGINPTMQRLLVMRVLLNHWAHLSADDVFRLVNNAGQQVSKATVYNTLGLLAERGVIREVIADPNRVFYDPNTSQHHHFYNIETGELTDIDASEVQVSGLPPLPSGASLQGVDVIVRLREAK